MPDKHKLQGSCVAKNMQSFVSGRPSLGLAKNVWMQLISPCKRGDSRSLLVATVTGDSEPLERMAAPKSLEPEDTLERVSGTIEVSVMERRADKRSFGVGLVSLDILDGETRYRTSTGPLEKIV